MSHLTPAQKTTLLAAVAAETDPAFVAALAIRDDISLAAFLNVPSNVNVWNSEMQPNELFQAMDLTKYDALTAGKRDAWALMLQYAPVDFGKLPNRKAVVDIWGTTDSVAVLNACVRKALNIENYLKGASVTTNTVSAFRNLVPGQIGLNDMSQVLNGA